MSTTIAGAAEHAQTVWGKMATNSELCKPQHSTAQNFTPTQHYAGCTAQHNTAQHSMAWHYHASNVAWAWQRKSLHHISDRENIFQRCSSAVFQAAYGQHASEHHA